LGVHYFHDHPPGAHYAFIACLRVQHFYSVMKPLVTHAFILSEIEKAFETLEHKPSGFNKDIVIPD